MVSDAALEHGIPLSRIFILTRLGERVTDRYIRWEELLHHGESDWVRFNDEQLAKNTLATISSTSGTTGLPKGALLSHQNLVAQSIVVMSQGTKSYEVPCLDSNVGRRSNSLGRCLTSSLSPSSTASLVGLLTSHLCEQATLSISCGGSR